MGFADYSVLIVYFVVLIVIGVISSLRIKKQEDFFMGGRSFGKLLQTFAAFGAGTGSSDPVNTARTTFTSGVSGMWSVMYWLFVTPFYWITGVWYRRMRHLTLGDWFVERYESRTMGAAYCIFGISFFMLYGSMLFSAIGKVAAPLMGMSEDESFQLFGFVFDAGNIEYLLVPVIGVFVLAYGILGGLRAAYFTDLIQGVCIILLSILLIPYGLDALVDKFGDASQSTMDGFRIMHERLPKESFSLVGSAGTSEFTLPLIIAVVMINLVGIVVQPHFIATGGGSAKTETNARVGLVVGNFLKRFCTIGWMLTAMIVLTLYSDNPTLLKDPDKTWGVASAELLGPGLTGLMLACLLAALMSSVDAYMIVGSGLVVRNIYAPFINPNATEKQCLLLGRLTGIIVVGGAVLMALSNMDVLALLKKTWVFPILFAAPFWVGMYWRRATTSATWITVAFSTLAFFAIPFFAPMLAPDMRTNPSLLATNEMTLSITTRTAAKTDVDRENAKNAEQIVEWNEQEATIQKMTDPAKKTAALETLGDIPLLKEGDEFTQKRCWEATAFSGWAESCRLTKTASRSRHRNLISCTLLEQHKGLMTKRRSTPFVTRKDLSLRLLAISGSTSCCMTPLGST